MTLDDRLADAARALRKRVQPPASPADLDRRAHRRSVRRVQTLGVCVATVVVLTLALLGRGSDPVEIAAGDNAVTVGYERVEYQQSATLDCSSAGPVDARGRFDRATVEAWGDSERLRWRNKITYPDGASRDLIVLGSPWHPSDVYTRGELRGAELGCEDSAVGILVAEPGQNSFFSLNPLAELPPPVDGAPAVPGYAELGSPVPGSHRDSRSRPAALWRQVVTGFLGPDATGTRYPVRQVTEWYVEPESGKVLEKVYESVVDGIGTARSTATLTESGTRHVPRASFDVAGYSKDLSG